MARLTPPDAGSPARELRDAHAVVVGATGALGGLVAAALAARGARVSAIVRDPARLDGASVAHYAVADLEDLATVRAAVASVAALGPIDVMVNAAGIVAFGPLPTLDDATLARLLAVNAVAPIALLREAAPHMREGSCFVQISGIVADSPVGGMAAYCASKAAASSAVRAAARDLRPRRIDVIDARPGHTETGLAGRAIAGTAPRMPAGHDPRAVAERIVAAIVAGERDLPPEAFAAVGA